MKRTVVRLLSFLLTALSPSIFAAAPSNSVTIKDQSGSAQSNRPFSISRVFAKGDIPHFAQAVVGGSAVTTQCDVKTRWPDGSVQHAIMSFQASLPASGSITVNFVDQATGNNAGAMTQAQMLAANWGAEIDITNGTTLTANARAMLTAWSGSTSDPRVTYWLQGPICTQVILEDRTTALSFDLGWDSYKPLHPIFVVTFYPGYSAGTKVEMILENMWTTKLEDQTYSLALKTGNPLGAPIYSQTNYTHISKSRWRKVFWSGAQPGAVNVDFNLPYMIYSQIVPNWDLSKTVSVTSDVNAFNSSDQGDLCPKTGCSPTAGAHALWQQYLPNTGGRPDIGVFPAWYVRYLYSFDPNEYSVLIGQAGVGSYDPMHFRESATGKFFDSAATINAFGRPLSIDARPTIWIAGLNRTDTTSAQDLITPVGTTTTAGWTDDLAHEPGWVYIPYLVTGDWYFLEELYFHAAGDLATASPGYANYNRGNSWGFFPFSVQTRGQAWGLRDVAHAALMAPDGTPEKAYFLQKLNNNIAIEEGNQNVLDGIYTPSDPTCAGYTTGGPNVNKWCFGRMTIGENIPNPLHFMDAATIAVDCSDPEFVPSTDPYYCSRADSAWMYGYKYNVLGHIQELGFGIGPLNQTQFLWLLHVLQDPAFNPWLSGAYEIGVRRTSTNGYYQAWGDVLNAYNTAYKDPCGHTYSLRTATVWMTLCGQGDSDVSNPGYPHIMKGAASYLAGLNVNDGALSGVSAWNWMVANVGYQNATGANPQYVVLPRNLGTGTPGTCDLNGDGVVDAVDVQLSINKALGLNTCGNGDLVGTGVCTVVDTQRVINAALGASCRLGP
jgi:hypothetical protein